MDYILSGDPAEIEKVIRENRIRCQRGLLQFTPVAECADTKDIPVSDTKDAPETDGKEPKQPKRAKKND